MHKIVFLVLLIPMLVFGQILSDLVFPNRVAWQCLFIVAWLLLNTYLIRKYLWRSEGVLILRLVTFAFLHSAALAILLLYVG